MSRTEDLIKAILNDESVDLVPRSRVEQYLKNCVDACGCDGLPVPRSRLEVLLYSLAEKMAGSGGGSGVTIRNQNKTITENGTYTADSGYTGLGTVTVDVQASGGGSDTNFVMGSFTPNSNLSEIRIDFPDVDKYKKFVLFTTDDIGAYDKALTHYSALTINGSQSYCGYSYNKSNAGYHNPPTLCYERFGKMVTLLTNIEETGDIVYTGFKFKVSIDNVYLFANKTYYWIFIEKE